MQLDSSTSENTIAFAARRASICIPTRATTGTASDTSAPPGDCRDCPLASTCPAKSRPNHLTRFVLRRMDQDLFDEVQAQMNEPNSVEGQPSGCGSARGCSPRRSKPLPRAGQVSRAVQSADPGLPLRDCAEPQAPALPTLLLAVSALAGLIRPAPRLHCHPTNRAHQPTAKTKIHSHFFNRPDEFMARAKHFGSRPAGQYRFHGSHSGSRRNRRCTHALAKTKCHSSAPPRRSTAMNKS